MHFVVFIGLEERTRYFYKVKGECTGWSPVYSFRSLYEGNRAGPTKFAIFGDMGVYAYNNMGNLERDVDEGRIDAIVHLGDHAYNLADADGARGDGYLNAFSRVLTRKWGVAVAMYSVGLWTLNIWTRTASMI